MPKTAITGPKQTDRSIAETLWTWRAEALWGLAALVLLFAFVNPLILLGLVVATAAITAAWWTYRNVAHRVDRGNAESALAAHLRPAPASRRDQDKTSAHAPWRGHHAA